MVVGEHGLQQSRLLTETFTDAEAFARAQALQQSLVRQLRDAFGDGDLLAAGIAPDRRTAWPGGVVLPDGRWRELRGRLTRPETAPALALASFLPWLPYVASLRLAGMEGFRELHFDARCPTGVRGTPPHIDFMASGASGVAGATVRVFDYLVRRPARISSAYASLAVPPGLQAWAAHLRSDAWTGFRHLDVVALAKLAVGIGRIFAGRQVRLVYLYLEPQAGADGAPFRRHREELARLADGTAGAAVTLWPLSFHELWADWQDAGTPEPVRGIVAELSRRYAVATGQPTRLG